MPSSRPRERFAPEEAAEVLRRTGIARGGAVERVVEFHRGSSRSPKLIVESRGRRWLIKRRAPANSDPERVRFCHDFHRLLGGAGAAVAPPRRFEDGSTALERDGHVYEWFDFIEGDRYRRTPDDAFAAGAALGRLLAAASQVSPEGDPVHGSFHASGVILGAVRLAEQSVRHAEPAVDHVALHELTESLRRLYRLAAERGIRSGFAATAVHPIHGDYHPGNLLFRHDDADGEGGGVSVAAIVDFDAARVEPRAVEVANAILQFGSRSLAGSDVDAWPEDLDPELVTAFVRGLRGAGLELELQERRAIPWLMIEACITEVVVPIARTGTFADLKGSAMLRFVARRAAKLHDSADSWLEALSS